MAKGTLIIAGGGLDTGKTRVFSKFIACAGGTDAKIAFVLAASGEGPDDTFASYRDLLVSLGAREKNCILLPLYAPGVTDARGENFLTGDAPELLARMAGASAVWFTGGDQYYISRCLLRPDGTDTALLAAFRRLYENGGVIGGSSAGAAIMSRVMIGEGSSRGVLAHGVRMGYAGYLPDAEDESPDSGCPLLLTSEGLGFLPGAVVDQHFNRRPRLLRLIEACMVNPLGCRYGFGVSEDTALVIEGGCCRVLGSGGVFFLDCAGARRTGAGCAENIRLSALYEGDILHADGRIAHARACPAGERFFQRDYISGATPDSALFDDAMDKLLRGDETSVWLKDGARLIRGAAVYGAGARTFLVTLTYALGDGGFGALNPETGHTSVANVTLSVTAREVAP